MRYIVRVSHILGLCREFFVHVRCLKICSSAKEKDGMIIQILLVSAADCLFNGVQLLYI